MQGIRHDVLLVLYSLSIVMVLDVLAIPLTEMKAGQLEDEPRGESNNASEMNKDIEHGKFSDDELGEGVVEGDGGCAYVPSEYTTAGAGPLMAFVLVLYLPNLLVKLFQL